MSSDYYFNKWKRTLASLESLTILDLEYQETKVHDKQRCDATERLSGILGKYIANYNDALDCLNNNLQVQKTVYIDDVVKAIVARILELKEQLRKVEGAYYHFLNTGITEHKLTPNEAEFSDIPKKYVRSGEINDIVIQIFQKVKEIIEQENVKREDIISVDLEEEKWWDDTVEIENKAYKKLDMAEVYKVEVKISEETLRKKQILAMIQAQEKTRQVTRIVKRQQQRREKWAKELQGTLNPVPQIKLRERSAALIQKVLRFYFKLKRQKIENCKRDEILQLRFCSKPSYQETLKNKEITAKKFKLYKIYEEQRKTYGEEFKGKYYIKNHDDISEHARDNIRDWFRKWYNEAMFFYDIPKENQGGSVLILNEEVPSPAEWTEQYQAYLDNKKAKKNKTSQQLKLEKQAAKEEEMMLKREAIKKKKLEANLLKKMMKNPTLHPGYKYPKSKKTGPLIQAIKKYYKDWYDLDKEDNINAKEKFIKKIDEEHLCMEVKLELNKAVDIDMRIESKKLKRALKEDYKRNEEEMPESMKNRPKRRKKKQKKKVKIEENFYNRLMDLAINGVLKEYPRRNFADYLGDCNFAGDKLRCMLRPPLNFGGETRAIWWESCREVIHGFKRILLIGPKGSGKTSLVHIMASVNDAILYELDPSQVMEQNQTVEYLQQLVNAVAICAKTTQPSVIHIKDVHRLYYNKIPLEELHVNLELIKRFFTRKLFKKIQHHDNVTIIGEVFLILFCPFPCQSRLISVCTLYAVEVGARGLPAKSLYNLLKDLGLTRTAARIRTSIQSCPSRILTNLVGQGEQLEQRRHLHRSLVDEKQADVEDISSCFTSTKHELFCCLSHTAELGFKIYCMLISLLRTQQLDMNHSDVFSNRVVPPNLDIHSLAHVLQGYSFGYLVKALEEFLTADKIIEIAAYGLTPQTVYEYIINDENQTKVDYQRYLKWYTEKTRWGKMESKRLKEDKEFRALVEDWKEKMQKKKNKERKINNLS